MHYFDGTEAKLGDTIAKEPAAGPEHYDGMLKEHETAVVTRLYPGNDACNVEAAVARPRGPGRLYGHIYSAGPGCEVAVAIDALTGTTKAFRLVARMGE